MNDFEEATQIDAPHMQKEFIQLNTAVLEEKLGVFDAIDTKNAFYNKVVSTFVVLC